MVSMALVLATGSNETLLATRKALIERAGHTVVTALGEREVAAACQKHIFEVAVIGQSSVPEVKHKIASLVLQSSPKVRILELYWPFQERAIPDADAWLEVPTEGPLRLAEHVSALAARPPKLP
jgi:hypothetical protein